MSPTGPGVMSPQFIYLVNNSTACREWEAPTSRKPAIKNCVPHEAQLAGLGRLSRCRVLPGGVFPFSRLCAPLFPYMPLAASFSQAAGVSRAAAAAQAGRSGPCGDAVAVQCACVSCSNAQIAVPKVQHQTEFFLMCRLGFCFCFSSYMKTDDCLLGLKLS